MVGIPIQPAPAPGPAAGWNISPMSQFMLDLQYVPSLLKMLGGGQDNQNGNQGNGTQNGSGMAGSTVPGSGGMTGNSTPTGGQITTGGDLSTLPGGGMRTNLLPQQALAYGLNGALSQLARSRMALNSPFAGAPGATNYMSPGAQAPSGNPYLSGVLPGVLPRLSGQVGGGY